VAGSGATVSGLRFRVSSFFALGVAVYFLTVAARESSRPMAELLTGDTLTHFSTSVLLVDFEHRNPGRLTDSLPRACAKTQSGAGAASF